MLVRLYIMRIWIKINHINSLCGERRLVFNWNYWWNWWIFNWSWVLFYSWRFFDRILSTHQYVGITLKTTNKDVISKPAKKVLIKSATIQITQVVSWKLSILFIERGRKLLVIIQTDHLMISGWLLFPHLQHFKNMKTRLL